MYHLSPVCRIKIIHLFYNAVDKFLNWYVEIYIVNNIEYTKIYSNWVIRLLFALQHIHSQDYMILGRHKWQNTCNQIAQNISKYWYLWNKVINLYFKDTFEDITSVYHETAWGWYTIVCLYCRMVLEHSHSQIGSVHRPWVLKSTPTPPSIMHECRLHFGFSIFKRVTSIYTLNTAIGSWTIMSIL